MKAMKKTLSIALSLVLCGSLVAPSFAASFSQLQGVIDSKESLWSDEGDVRIGYDDGNVTLYEDIEYGEGEEEDAKSIVVTEDVTIDLNGHDIDGNDRHAQSALVEVKGGDLTIKDSTAHTDEETGEYVSGAITGGYNEKGTSGNAFGGGVSVTDGGSLTLESGAISGNHADQNGGGVYVGKGTFEMEGGLIDGNSTVNAGGGVFLNSELAAASQEKGESKFTMTGGTISNNTVDDGNGGGGGGGVSAVLQKVEQWGTPDYTAIDLNGGTITENHAGSGGGVYVVNGTMKIDGTTISGNTSNGSGAGMFVGGASMVEMTNGNITGNEAQGHGGGIYLNNETEFTMADGTITGNTAAGVGGGLANNASFTMNGGKLYGNDADDHSDDIYNYKNGTLKLPTAGSMGVTGADGKDITGWYYDGTDGWGNGDKPYLPQNNATGGNGYTGTLCLKAAHDEYVDVVYMDRGTVLQTSNVEKGTDTPAYGGAVPTRPGYEFAGWLTAEGEEYDLNGKVPGAVTLVAQWNLIPVDDPFIPADDPAVEIEDPAVPLAYGPTTRAEFIDYLWRHEGEPEGAPCTFTDVPEDHTYVLALGWAQENGIAVAYEDGTFEPDELVTVAAVREFLTNFAKAFEMTMPELTTLVGEEDELVFNCSEVIAEFFGEELPEQTEAE